MTNKFNIIFLLGYAMATLDKTYQKVDKILPEGDQFKIDLRNSINYLEEKINNEFYTGHDK